MVDVERDPLRFRFRLVGTRVCDWFGHDATGPTMWTIRASGDLDPGHGRDLPPGRREPGPRYVQRDVPELGAFVHSFDRLVLPLVGEDGAVDKLICGIWVRPWQEQRAIAN